MVRLGWGERGREGLPHKLVGRLARSGYGRTQACEGRIVDPSNLEFSSPSGLYLHEAGNRMVHI